MYQLKTNLLLLEKKIEIALLHLLRLENITSK